jgi:phosphoserine phosphatase
LDCVEILIRLPEITADDMPDVQRELAKAGTSLGVDVSLQRDELVREAKHLAVFDMDSTLIQLECIDEMAAVAGVGEQVKDITHRAMNGELDFEQSLRCRVALLKGMDAEPLFEKIRTSIVYTPGAHFVTAVLKKLSFSLAVVSGGFTSIICTVKEALGLDSSHANVLDVSEDDKLTGLLAAGTSVVDSRAKARCLRDIAHNMNIEPEAVVAVGDGANDLLMMKEAGVGIAFNAKPVVQEQALFRINVVDLTPVLFHLGINREDAVDILSVK